MRQIVVGLAAVAVLLGVRNSQPVTAACTPLWDTQAGNPGLNSAIFKLLVFDDGTGRQIYAAGGFTTAGGAPAVGIARWNGRRWSAVGDGLGPSNGGVWGMASFDDGRGAALYAGGDFVFSGSTRVDHIARWDGQAWQPVGEGTNASVLGAMTVFDDGSGPALYVGGDFTTAGGVPARGVARWDGRTWSEVGGGFGGTIVSVRAFAIFDDGSGPALYAGGLLSTAGGTPASCIAKWDGQRWSPVGGGTNGLIRTLAVVDLGSGPALYAGGGFTEAGGSPASRIAKWDGSEWTSLGDGASATVRSIVGFTEWGAPQLYAGGDFRAAGSKTVNGIARWDGREWHALSEGMNSSVAALAVYGTGNSLSLYAGGLFTLVDGRTAYRIARWQPCGPVPRS